MPAHFLGFTVEGGLVLQAIIARETAHQRAVGPIVEDPADIFPRNACHRGEVALRDFLPNEDAALADVMAERLREAQQRVRNPSFHGEKIRGYQRFVGVTQPSRGQGCHVTVEFRGRLSKRLECGTVDKAQLRIAKRSDRSRARRAVDNGQLADNGTGPEYCESTLTACRYSDARLEQAFLNPIASVTLISLHKQGLRSCKRDRARLGEQTVG